MAAEGFAGDDVVVQAEQTIAPARDRSERRGGETIDRIKLRFEPNAEPVDDHVRSGRPFDQMINCDVRSVGEFLQVEVENRLRLGKCVCDGARASPDLIGPSGVISCCNQRMLHGSEVDAIGKIDVPKAADSHGFMEAHGFDKELEPARKDPALRLENTAFQVQEILKHVLVEQLVSHLLVQDDVDEFGRSELSAVGLHKFDVVESVVLGDVPGDVDEV